MTAEKKPKKWDKTLDLGEALSLEMKEVSEETGVASTALIRICLKAGLNQIKRENYLILKADDEFRAEMREALLAELSTISTKANQLTSQSITQPSGPRSLLSDRSEVAFYADGNEAGHVTGLDACNPPVMIPIPAEWTLEHIDFVAPVHGESMKGLIEDGQLAAYVHITRPSNGEIVAAVVDGVSVLKMYHVVGEKRELRSINQASRYKPIPVTDDVRFQGRYVGIFPPLSKDTLKKIKAKAR